MKCVGKLQQVRELCICACSSCDNHEGGGGPSSPTFCYYGGQLDALLGSQKAGPECKSSALPTYGIPNLTILMGKEEKGKHLNPTKFYSK